MINLSHLYSACIQLALKSCEIIRRVHADGSLSTFYKTHDNGDEPCTVADLHSQRVIMSSLERYFPGLRMIGEEEVTTDPDLYISLRAAHDINLNLLTDGIQGSFPIEEITLWIDPLDGTICFVSDDLAGVTCMIGIAHKEKPIFGVIGHPFASPSYALWVIYKPGRAEYWSFQDV